MPNPRAQKNPTFIPQALQGLADMGRGAVRGALSESLGTAGDVTQALKNIKTAGFMPAMLARGLQGPTSEEMSQALRGITPNPLTQPDRAHTARFGQDFGSIPLGAAAGTASANLAAKASNRLKNIQQTQAMMPRQPRSAAEILQPKLFTNTTETLAGYAGDAINKAMLGETSGLLSKALDPVAPRKLFIGPGSQSWDEQAAFKASKMEAANVSPQEIWAKTGTFRGPDGHWRQEISDKGSVLGLSQTKGSADEILRHPELYAAYPELASTKMNLYGTMKGAPEIKASLSGTPKEGFQVDIYEPGIKDGPRMSAIHEMQHAIQDIEGFSPGGNRSQAFLHPGFQEIKQDTLKTLRPAGGPIDPVLLNNLAADSYYYRLGGEAEARAAARRANMDEAERRATFPLESYDMLPDRTINIAPYANGGMVSGRHNDDGNGAMGADSWRADNAVGGLVQMANGGTPYKGINPMATGLGKMIEQSKVRKTASEQMALARQAEVSKQEALRAQRQKQLAAAKTARLAALAPKLSTYVPGSTAAPGSTAVTGSTTTTPPGSSTAVPGVTNTVKTAQPAAEPKLIPSSVADIAQNVSENVVPMTAEEYAQAGLRSEQLRKDRFLNNVEALKVAFPNDWWNRDIASYYGGKDTNWLNETMKGINAQGAAAKNAYENPPPLADEAWFAKTGSPYIYRDPKSGYGVSMEDGKLGYYNPQGNLLRRSVVSAEDLYKNANEFGINLGGIGSLGQKLDAAGINYKPGQLRPGTGSNHGINFADIAANKLGAAYDWTQDPLAAQKGPGATESLAASQALAQKLGLDLTTSENLATLSPQMAGDVTRQFVVSTPSMSGTPTYSWYDTQQQADQAAQQYGGTVTNLAGQTITPPKGARGGLVSMAGGGVVRMSDGGGKFGLVKAGGKQAAKAFKALPGESFQGKSGLSALSPDEEARRLIAKMDQPSIEDVLKTVEEPKPVTAAQRAAAGRAAAKQIATTQVQRLSDVLGNLNIEGKGSIGVGQSDRTRVGGGNIGGAHFPGIQHADPLYEGMGWGVGNVPTASNLIANFANPGKYFTTLLGSEHQLKTNPVVFERLKKGFIQAMKEGKLQPELEAKINHNLALTFGEGADIRDPQIWKKANTFEKRAALGDIMLGRGIPPKKGGVALGGEKSGKGVIFNPSDILREETEKMLLHPEHGGNVPTFAVGPRLVQFSGDYSVRPDLHPGFPVLLHGKDMNVVFNPVPGEIALPDFVAELAKPSEKFPKGKKPGYYEWTMGLPGKGLPSQPITEEYLRHLQREGFKKGGKVKKMQAGGIAKAVKSGLQALEKPAKQTITSAIDPTTDIASRLTQPDRINLLPMPSRWFLDPKNNPGVQKLVEKVLDVNNMKRSDFYSGAFVNPRTGEVMDKKVMQDVGVLINPATGRPMMSAEKEVDLTIGDRNKGSKTKSNLVRKQLYETEGDPILKDLDFLVAIEQSGMGHKYGLATEYATPAEMFNTMTGDNPTLRPMSRGDVFGIGDIVGRMSMKSSKMPHDVYESLLIAPKGSDVQGVKLSKKKGGLVKGRK